MTLIASSNNPRKGQAIILFTLMLGTVFVPMVGMGIDGVRAYLVKAKLSTAIDGAAIAAASSLSSGSGETAQAANAVATATEVADSNFPVGYFGSSLQSGSPTVCVDPGDGSNPCGLGTGGTVNTYKKRTVVITAYATVPTLFMRIIGYPTTTVAATGQASRRDVRVVLVIDRSSSMTSIDSDTGNTAIVDAVNQAGIFVGKFAPGRDELGLVVMGGSAIVAYPPRNPANDPTLLSSFTAPDTNWNSASPSLPYLITQIKGGSNTGTAEALYLAYMTLKADAATNTALPDMLNVIVFFTDGLPNGITTFANDPNGTSLKSTSPCTYRTSGSTHPMKAWFAQWNGDTPNDSQGGKGLFTPMMTTQYPGTSGNDIVKWMQNPGTDNNIATNTDNCSFDNPSSNNDYISHDFSKIPDQDLYGNRTNFDTTTTPALYTYGTYYANAGGIAYNNTKINDSYQVGLASWNAAADQSWKIWNNMIYNSATRTIIADPNPIDPVIFTIGYWHTSEQPDATLMNIMANTTASPIVVSTKMHGQYFQATSADQVNQAFADIASEILRLAQ
jgi:Flp pilus assembly protein TadG